MASRYRLFKLVFYLKTEHMFLEWFASTNILQYCLTKLCIVWSILHEKSGITTQLYHDMYIANYTFVLFLQHSKHLCFDFVLKWCAPFTFDLHCWSKICCSFTSSLFLDDVLHLQSFDKFWKRTWSGANTNVTFVHTVWTIVWFTLLNHKCV